jgi:hypothetical protein
VDPVLDPLLLRKSGSAVNRTRNLWVCSRELWPLGHRNSLCKHIKIRIWKAIFRFVLDILVSKWSPPASEQRDTIHCYDSRSCPRRQLFSTLHIMALWRGSRPFDNQRPINSNCTVTVTLDRRDALQDAVFVVGREAYRGELRISKSVVTMQKEAIYSSETSCVVTRAARPQIPEDTILYCYRCEE